MSRTSSFAELLDECLNGRIVFRTVDDASESINFNCWRCSEEISVNDSFRQAFDDEFEGLVGFEAMEGFVCHERHREPRYLRQSARNVCTVTDIRQKIRYSEIVLDTYLPVMDIDGGIVAHGKMSCLRRDFARPKLTTVISDGSTDYLKEHFADYHYIGQNSYVLDGREMGSYQNPRSHNILREAAMAKQSIDTADCVERKLVGLQWQDVWLKLCPECVPCKLNNGRNPRWLIRHQRIVPETHRKLCRKPDHETRYQGETLSMDRRCMVA